LPIARRWRGAGIERERGGVYGRLINPRERRFAEVIMKAHDKPALAPRLAVIQRGAGEGWRSRPGKGSTFDLFSDL
jgi:hypothetical protein